MDDKPDECEESGQNFAHTSDLNKYMRSHTGEKPFECEECGLKFAQRSHLQRHEKSHGREAV
jgi:KRAB domain-containing zinc finger protein